MMTFWPIAVTTFKEGIRNRAFYGISLFALLLLGSNFLIAGMIPRDISKVAVDMALSTVSFAGLLLVLFIGINLIAKDLDKRTIYTVLARPISRSQYLMGKFGGMLLLILSTVLFLGFAAFLSIMMLRWAYPSSFGEFAWMPVVLSIFFIALSLIVLSSISFLFSSFTSTSFITLILTVITYVIGQSLADVRALVEAPQTVGIQVSPVTVKMVQIAYYIFPNLSLFDFKMQASHGLPLPPGQVIWTAAYGVVYVSLAIVLAALLFRRKEFP